MGARSQPSVQSGFALLSLYDLSPSMASAEIRPSQRSVEQWGQMEDPSNARHFLPGLFAAWCPCLHCAATRRSPGRTEGSSPADLSK